MFGETQKQWFLDRVTNSERFWKFWGNDVMIMQLKILNTYKDQLPPAAQDKFPSSGDGIYVNLDQWDVYQAEREEILKTISIKE
jgi:alkaline phosphatase D